MYFIITVWRIFAQYSTRIITYIYSCIYYSRIRYTGPPGFLDEEEEATGATEAVLGLPRLGGTATSGATRPR